jgi:hypothetical protein
MKTTLFLVLILSGFFTFAANTVTPSQAPPSIITGVSTAKDKRTLVVRYELSGRSHEQRVAFTNDITDFRYCRWLGEQGIAVVASMSTDEIYFTTLYLNGRAVPSSPVKIPAPSSKSRLLGIANTGGDSLVITAVQHRRDGSDSKFYGPDRLTGWMYIDNCPPIASKAGGGVLIPFDLSAPKKGEAK